MPWTMPAFVASLMIVQRAASKSATDGKPSTNSVPSRLDEVRRICKARPVNTALDEVVKNRRFDEVRTEGKVLMSLMRAWELVAKAAEDRL